jgi:hypothetical protein
MERFWQQLGQINILKHSPPPPATQKDTTFPWYGTTNRLCEQIWIQMAKDAMASDYPLHNVAPTVLRRTHCSSISISFSRIILALSCTALSLVVVAPVAPVAAVIPPPLLSFPSTPAESALAPHHPSTSLS